MTGHEWATIGANVDNRGTESDEDHGDEYWPGDGMHQDEDQDDTVMPLVNYQEHQPEPPHKPL